ncbi:hypothetical protein OLX02_04700 [Novosphingobium sp. KCTC 2891]|uniref:hypothetical protein n=1 Tax=Novosphingobium sp. KCTC 2891 TaxID=2989730 RepID=UPI002221D10F|nr:hypothetical protein [Novosphingobium sp. KCTC 2891]MCW1382112.1 hypothetical protein [Novosphingobium sp. KCTC 2891]
MDNYRGFDSDRTDVGMTDFDTHEDESAMEPPPPAVGQDERRMQVRAYNFWAGLLGDGPYPPVATLLDGKLPDFAANAVLLRFDRGIDDPAIAFLGAALADECGTADDLKRLSDVPGRSLLSRITDHYLQIIANQAPIGFEAEFVNQRGRTILYRGILLPFTSNGTAIDFIYGVINWKEVADQVTTNELLLEIGQALEPGASLRRATEPLSEWADGPATLDLAEIGAQILPFPGSIDETDFAAAPMPGPAFGLSPAAVFDDAPVSLDDWLSSARELAHVANSNEDRTRSALYAAIGRAWDFALAAQAAPEDYRRMVEQAGLTMQERAPLTPLVKLVFGADYDKTRLTEYATALGHAQRLGLGRGELGRFLSETAGGLKGVVALERRLRREEAGEAKKDPRDLIAEDLRALPARSLAALPREGSEFALVMVRRMPGGEIALLGEVPEDLPLFERAARRLVG